MLALVLRLYDRELNKGNPFIPEIGHCVTSGNPADYYLHTLEYIYKKHV